MDAKTRPLAVLREHITCRQTTAADSAPASRRVSVGRQACGAVRKTPHSVPEFPH